MDPREGHVTTYIHDDVEFDLDNGFVDVLGIEWKWTGGYSDASEPLLVCGLDGTPFPLPDVYHDHGPLIPLPKRPTRALARQVVAEDYTASVAAGLTESYEDYALRTARASQ